MSKRVLVTAGNGMGPYIIKAYQDAGYEVFTIARNEARKQSALARSPHLPSDHVLVYDLASDEALTPGFWQKVITGYRIDGIINNAMVTPKNSITKPGDKDQQRTYRVNTEMATALFEAAAASDIPVIQQSTDKAHILNDAHDVYRQSKDLARRALQKLAAEKNLKGIVIEPGMAAVPGEGRYRLDLMAEMPVKMKLLQKPGIMQPIDLDDLTQVMVGMMENLWNNRTDRITPGTVYQAAGDQPMNLDQYIRAIREALGVTHRKQLPIPMPLRIAQSFMRVAGKLPFADLSPFDYFDMQELQRDFSVKPEDVAAFMKAGNLPVLRDPIGAYKRYAEKHAPETGVGAMFALVSLDLERWLKSVRHEKFDSSAPPTAGAPDLEALRAQAPRADRKTVLVTGATGFVGPVLVQELLAAGNDIVCTVRSPEKAKKELPYPGIRFIKVDMNADTDPALWKKRLEEYHIDTVVNNAGIEANSPGQKMENINVKAALALAQACADLQQESGKAKRFIQISSSLITAKNYSDFAYPRSKKQTEDGLAGMKNLDWVVVRPDYIYEPGRGHLLFEEMVKLPMLAFVNDGAKQPISNRDLALGVAKLVDAGSGVSHQVLEAAGTENLRWRDMLQYVSEATQEELKYTPRIPRALALSMIALKRAVPQVVLKKIAPYAKVDAATLMHIAPEIFKMLSTGTHSDPQGWIKATGIEPSTLAEVYRAWHESPAAYAALYAQKRQWKPSRRTPSAGMAP